MKKTAVKILSALLMLSMVFSTNVFAANDETTSAWDSFLGLFSTTATTDVGVEYRGHIENKGDFPLDGTWIQGPNELGTRGQFLRMEGFWIQLTNIPDDLNIKYNVHVQNEGWLFDEDDSTDWATNGEFAGTKAKAQRIEAVKIVLVDDEGNLSTDYDVLYQGHVQDRGDLPADGSWYENGEQLGTVASSLRLEALKVKIVQKEADLTEYDAALAAVTQADYTTASWSTYKAVVDANVVDEDNLQSEVDAATAAIIAAQANLVKVLKVESVSAINTSQVKVVFNKEVSKASAETVANYSINNTALTGSTIFGGAGSIATLQADNKTVILEARTTLMTNNASFTLKTENVTDLAFNKIATTYNTVTTGDLTAPSIVSVTSTAGTAGTKNVTVVFSEPLALGSIGAYQINGQNAVATIDATNKAKVNVVASTTMAAGSTNTIKVTSVTDGINSSPQLTQTFVVGSDSAALSVVSVTQSNSKLVVVFDKEVSTANFASLTRGTNSSADISLTKQGDATAYITTAPALDPADTTNKTVLFTIAGTVYGTQNSATTVFTLKNIEDIYGNKMAALSQSLTLTKDTAKPTLASSAFDTANNKTFNLTFSEEVALPNLTAGGTTVTLIDTTTGADVTATILAGAAAGDTILAKSDWTAVAGAVTASKYVKMTVPVALTAGRTYNVTIPANTVLDVAGNKMDATTFAVTASASSDTTKPVVTKKAAPAAAVVSGKNVISIVFDENVQLADAINTGNYVLNGNALPAGTVIVNTNATNTKTFDITLPADGVTADVLSASLLVTGVRDIAGNAVVPTTLTKFNTAPAIDLADTKVPVLIKVEATKTDELVFTFDEPITLVPSGTAAAEMSIISNVTVNIDLDAAGAITYLGNTATVPTIVTPLGGINFTNAVFTNTATVFTDRAATANAAAVKVAGDAFKPIDKFNDAATVGAVTLTDKGTVGVHDITEALINITKPTNADVDRILKYEIYIAPSTAPDYTTVANVESNLAKLATYQAADVGAPIAMPISAGLYLSDGTTLVSTFSGSVDTYVIAVDELGNKALLSELIGGPINFTN